MSGERTPSLADMLNILKQPTAELRSAAIRQISGGRLQDEHINMFASVLNIVETSSTIEETLQRLPRGIANLEISTPPKDNTPSKDDTPSKDEALSMDDESPKNSTIEKCAAAAKPSNESGKIRKSRKQRKHK